MAALCADEDMMQRKTVVEATGGRVSVAIGKKRGADQELEPANVVVGDKVVITAVNLTGIVRFFGKTLFAAGEWLGLELDDAQGKNDGSVKGQRYFECRNSHGLFVRPTAVARIEDATPPSPMGRRHSSRTKAGMKARGLTCTTSASADVASPSGEATSPSIFSEGGLSPGYPSGFRLDMSGPLSPCSEASPPPPMSPSRPKIRSSTGSTPQQPEQQRSFGAAPEGASVATHTVAAHGRVVAHHIDDESDYEHVDSAMELSQRSSLTDQHELDWSAVGKTRMSTTSTETRPRKVGGSSPQRSPTVERLSGSSAPVPPLQETAAALQPKPLALSAAPGREDVESVDNHRMAAMPSQTSATGRQGDANRASPKTMRESHDREASMLDEQRAAQLELAEAAEDHDPERIAQALARARVAGVPQDELRGAQSILSFEAQQSLLLEIEGVRASVSRLARTVEAAEARAHQAEQRAALAVERALSGMLPPHGDLAPLIMGPNHCQHETWTMQLHQQLEKRVWEGLETRVDQAVRGAIARATSGIEEAVGIVREIRNGGHSCVLDAGPSPLPPLALPAREPDSEACADRQRSRAVARSVVRSSILSLGTRRNSVPDEAPAAFVASLADDARGAHLPTASPPSLAERESARKSARLSLGLVLSGAHDRLMSLEADQDRRFAELDDEAAICLGDIREFANIMLLVQSEAFAAGEMQAIRQSFSLMYDVEEDARRRISELASRAFSPSPSPASFSRSPQPEASRTTCGSEDMSWCGSDGSPTRSVGSGVRSSLKSRSGKGCPKKSVSFCQRAEASHEVAATCIQRAVRRWLARRRRWKLRTGRPSCTHHGAGVVARLRRPEWARVFDNAVQRRAVAGFDGEGLDFEGFAWGVSEVHARVTRAQIAALWEGFSQACDVCDMRLAAFCDILEAISEGDHVACEFADIPVDAYAAMGRRGKKATSSGNQGGRTQDGVAARQARSYAAIFKVVTAGKALGLDQRGFIRAMHQAHPLLRIEQAQVLWTAFENGSDLRVMGDETFCKMCEAIDDGPDSAAEFADIPCEDFLALGAVDGVGGIEATWDTNEDMQRVLERVEEEMAAQSDDEDARSEDFDGGLPEDQLAPEGQAAQNAMY